MSSSFAAWRMLLVLLLLPIVSIAGAIPYTPVTRERAQLRETAIQLFLAQDWKNLESGAARFRQPTERFSNGEWKLPIFYTGLRLGFGRLEKQRQGAGDEAVAKWLAAAPNSMSARLLAVSSVTAKAWKIRGSGMADTVSEENMQKFHAEMRVAWALLMTAEQLPDRDPHLYELAIDIGMGLQLDRAKMDQVLAKAISIAPDYQPVYDDMAFYLLPRWHGKIGDSRIFAEYVADKVTSSGGDIRYAFIAYRVLNAEGADQYKLHQFSMDRIRKGLLEREAKFPDPSFTYNVLARFYWALRDQNAAREIVAKLTQYDAEAANIWASESDFIQFREWATGKGALPEKSEMSDVFQTGKTELIKAFVEKMPDINVRDANQSTALQYALAVRNLEIVKLLLAKGADVTASTPLGAPIHAAARNDVPEVVQLAISKGANVREPASNLKWLPIHYAAAGGSTQSLLLLLKAAPDTVNARTRDQETPLVLAAGLNKVEAVRVLMAAKADPNLKDRMDFTPLHKAAYYGYDDSIRVLLEHKADVNATSKNWGTPLQVAKARQRPNTARLLEQHGGR